MTINARGLGSPLNNNLLFDLIEKSACDICFVQETLVSSEAKIKVLSRRWLGRSYWSLSIGKQGGVAVLISPKCSDEVVSWKKDSNGRIISILVRIDGVDLNFVNIYAPTNRTDRKLFYESLHEYFVPASALVIGGDFNCYENALDKFGGNVSVGGECKSLKSDFVLVDAWRKLHPSAREFTWFNHDYSIASRLDKFFVSKELFTSDCQCEISPCPLSDHDFVSFVFDIPDAAKRGPGVWKLNNSLLDDKTFCGIIRNLIQSHVLYFASFPSPQDWWEFLKVSIKEESISFSRQKRRQLCRDRVFLTNKLISLRQRLVNGDNFVVDSIQDIECRLKVIYTKEIEGILVRSRAEWLEEGERPTRYFFQLHSSNAQRSKISSIYNSSGVEVSSQDEIEQAHFDFYSSLFSEEPVDMVFQDDLLSSLSRQLSPHQSSLCEGTMTIDKISFAVKNMNTNKSPGPDGLTVEFYRKFWDILAPHLVLVFNSCFQAGEMCESMKTSNTRVIYKKGDRKSLKNWRPISLLNVDYKICSKAISIRLSKVLEFIVDPDQTCSVPGRKISVNLHTLRDILDYLDRTGEAGILVSLDQEKAFDRVNRSFLQSLLTRFGFGPSFRNWINTFYKGANMRVIVNEWLTEPIPLSRGVRQGDSLSPMLYILCVETLACQIRSCSQIEGFLLPGANGSQYKVSIYADDTTSLVKSVYSLAALFRVINVYERGSGAKLNVSKTEAMWLGAWRSRADQPFGLTWVTKMKILGVVFGQNAESDNWRPKLKKLENHLNFWKSRSLSLVGKSLIVNTIGISKLLYLATILPVPQWVISEVNNLIWPFLWGCRMETVSRQSCHQPFLKGGLGIINFKIKADALKLASVVSYCSNADSKSFYLIKYFFGAKLSPIRPEWRFLRDNSSPSAQLLTPFYSNCLSVLSSLRKILSCQDWRNFAFTSKKCNYTLLKEKSSSPVIHRHWVSFLTIGFDLDRHWSLVRDDFCENFKNDLLWLIVLRAVKVRDALKNWGYINSDCCASCSRKETIDHCFLNCSRVKAVWSHFSPLLSSLLGVTFLPNCISVFFFQWPRADAKSARLARFLIKTTLYGIWKFRNKATFHNGHEDSQAIIRYIKTDIRKRISLDHFRLSQSDFASAWESTLCKVADSSFHVLL